MAKKKNKSRKKRRDKKQTLLDKKPEQLIEMADGDMNSGSVRNAISLYKMALKKEGDKEIIEPLLFTAYLARSKQLQSKGMFQEAQATLKNAVDLNIDPKMIKETDLFVCVDVLPPDEGVRMYNDYADSNGPGPLIEKKLAAAAILKRDPDSLYDLKTESGLASHIEDVKNAVVEMDKGDWGLALRKLASVPRSSSWAELKMFCKAMVSFGAGDDTALNRALSGIPDTFFFPKTIDALKTISKTLSHEAADGSGGRLFFDGDFGSPKNIQRLAELAEQNNTDAMETVFRKVVEDLAPKNRMAMNCSLMDLIWQKCSDATVSTFGYDSLAVNVLNQNFFDVSESKAFFNYGPDPLTGASDYLDYIDIDFRNEAENRIARSEILTKTVLKILDNESFFYMDYGGMAGLQEYLNPEMPHAVPKEPNAFCFEMLSRAIDIDPENRQAYLLLERCMGATGYRKRFEKNLERMMTQFPDDPWPCLKLADLYDRKNAYRKAEKILTEAMRRAPQDRTVQERYAFSFVIAAEKNLRTGKLPLAETDLTRAEKLNFVALAEIIAEKRIVLEVLKSKRFSAKKMVESEMNDLTPWQRVRVLGLLIPDLEMKSISSEKFLSVFRSMLKANRKEFSSREHADLLRPVEERFILAFPGIRACETVLETDTRFLDGISDEDLIGLMASMMLVTRGWENFFFTALKRRLKKASPNNMAVLEFCFGALGYLEGDFGMLNMLKNVSKKATPQELYLMKAIAKNLAPVAQSGMGERLQQFHFDIFSDFRPFGFDDEVSDDCDELFSGLNDFEEEELPISTEEEEAMAVIFFIESVREVKKKSPLPVKKKLLDAVDMILSQNGLKGRPDSEILEFRNELTAGLPDLIKEMKRAFTALEPAIVVNLPRETYLFLKGEKR